MMNTLLLAVSTVVVLGLAASPATASEPIFSFGGSLSQIERGEDGRSWFEPGSFQAASLHAMGSHPSIASGLTFQWGLSIDGSQPEQNNDAVVAIAELDLHLGRPYDGGFLGTFLTFGSVEFSESHLNAHYAAVGLSHTWHLEDWVVSSSLGSMVVDAENGETFTDAGFASISATRFLSGGNTALSGNVSVARGTQDYDTVGFEDELNFIEFGVGVERMLDRELLGGRPSIYGNLNYAWANEVATTTSDQNSGEARVEFGFRVLLGASSLQDRARRTASGLPHFGRWQSIVPVVD